MLPWLHGILPVLPTPFTADDEVDFAVIPRLLDFAAQSGIRTVVTPAFGSEFYKLDAGERQCILETTVEHASAHGIKVVAQCNHSTPRLASKLSADAARVGAVAVSTALPRAFASSERQLLDHARRVCDSTELPVIVQDWNPGGVTAEAPFFIKLHQHCENFRMAKLEEPGIGETIRRIREETSGHVGVLSGWGGTYALQLHSAGLAGLMPGLATADVFVKIWQNLTAGEFSKALSSFAMISPYLQFSLQNFEQFHHAEKRLLQRRGIMPHAHVRAVTVDLDIESNSYLDHLTSAIAQSF